MSFVMSSASPTEVHPHTDYTHIDSHYVLYLGTHAPTAQCEVKYKLHVAQSPSFYSSIIYTAYPL